MPKLNLPAYNFRIKKENDKISIFDEIRMKYVSLTPEEWVRQNFLRFLVLEKHYPASLLSVECQLTVNGLKKRCDAVVYNIHLQPIIIIEFKAPHVKISQQTFDQVAVYNSKLNVSMFILSNGLEHYCCSLSNTETGYTFQINIPDYNEISSL